MMQCFAVSCAILFWVCSLATAASLGKNGDGAMRLGLQDQDPFVRMEAEVMNYAEAAVVYDCDTCSGGKYVGNLDGGEAIGYSDLDFQGGADGFSVSFSGWQPGNDTGVIFLSLDYLGNAPFASVTTYNTGGTLSFITSDQLLGTPITGVHHLYFTFVSNSTGTTNVCNLDWFQFSKLDFSTTAVSMEQ